jgi:ethanolamine ammonia-lyase small subunit
VNRDLVETSAWQRLRQATPARIALGRAGGSLPTAPMLDFQLAHARARDAVHLPFDPDTLASESIEAGFDVRLVRSRASDRQTYLRRPDLGRRLDDVSRAALAALGGAPVDAVFVIGDGLSSGAVHRHSLAVLRQASTALAQDGWSIGPVILAQQARVALADEIGELLQARQVAHLIGERPGLSAADSLGIYLTWQPRVGRTDAERNCISNVRPAGVEYAAAAHTLVYLMREAARRAYSGVRLKDESAGMPPLTGPAGP